MVLIVLDENATNFKCSKMMDYFQYYAAAPITYCMMS